MPDSKISLLLWNVEGLKGALDLTPGKLLSNHDILIMTETLVTCNIEIPGFYSKHVFATQGPRGRPMKGISWFYKPTIGEPSCIYEQEHTLILQTERMNFIGLYIEPLTPIEDVIEIVMTAIAKATPRSNIIIAGDLNCRIDTSNHKSRELLQMMIEEGYTLVNEQHNRTYFAHNGSSTIDLIFYKGTSLEILDHKVCYSAAGTPI